MVHLKAKNRKRLTKIPIWLHFPTKKLIKNYETKNYWTRKSYRR